MTPDPLPRVSKACREALYAQVRTLPFKDRRKLIEAARRTSRRTVRSDWRMWCWGALPYVPVIVGLWGIHVARGHAPPLRLLLVMILLFLPVYFLSEQAVGKMRARIVAEVIAKQFPFICRTCGYDLTGNTSGVCPECGIAIAKT